MTKFNVKQLEAINSPIDKNVIVSASAGSGKTEILAQKVLNVLTTNGLNPEEILVLTFTNKAAYEMKQRIISTIKKEASDNHDLISKILSAHIQTFDAFSMYLVKTYSRYLKIPNNIQIVDSTFINLLKKKYLDEIILDYINKDDLAMTNLIKKEDSFKYENTKEIISEIYDYFSNMSDEEIIKIKKISNSDSSFYKKKFEKYILERTRTSLLYPITLLCYLNTNNQDLSYDELINNFYSFIKDKNDDDLLSYVKGISFNFAGADKWASPLKDTYVLIIESIINKQYDQLSDNLLDKFSNIRKRGEVKYTSVISKFNSTYKDLFYIIEKGDKVQLDNIFSTRDELNLIFDIVDNLKEKINKYKVLSNAYEYKDISQMALKLFEIDETRDILQNKFKFIIVDEYQDTNDEQEKFISLLSKNAKLFLVGDVKQSIYRFRGSKVELFINRKNDLSNSKDGQVINMNYNYRSFEKVLTDINMIFYSYMSKKNGGVSYSSAEESLQYDKKANIYDINKLPYPNNSYGLSVMTYSSDQLSKASFNECMLIIQDIKKKIKEKYLINTKDGIRPCKYSDFAILTRKKRSFGDYSLLFEKASVPLVNQVEVDLKDVDVFLLIKSILYLIATRMNLIDGNELHYFVSIARSYIYGNSSEYTDEYIHKIVMDKKNDSVSSLYNESSIIKKIDGLISKYNEYPFNYLFNEIIEEFGILSKLSSIGNIKDNIEKVYSLYSELTTNLDSGLGLKEYILSLEEYNKYNLELKYTFEGSNEDAVKLISLHGSKGLEFPIVYLPVSDNNVELHPDRKITKISPTLGVLLPNYFPYLDENKICRSFLFDLYKREGKESEEENSENARLYYVLFTRAKENIYIVGNKPKTKKGTQSLYTLLEFIPHEYIVNENYLYNILDKEYLEPLLDRYYVVCKRYIDFTLNRNKYLDNFSLENTSLFDNYYYTILNSLNGEKENIEYEIYKQVYEYLLDLIEDKKIKISSEEISSLIGNPKVEKDKSLKQILDNYINKKYSRLKNIVLKLYEIINKFTINIFDIKYKDLNSVLCNITPDALLGGIEKPQIFTPSIINDQRIIIDNEERKTNDDSLIFIKKEKKKASKEIVDLSKDDSILEFGSEIHKLLELTDFKTKDTSFINNLSPNLKKMKNKIDKFLSLEFLKDLSSSKVYKEYEFYSEDNLSKGSIDCLIIKGNCAVIIDYKLKDISDEKYVDQLSYYAKEVKRLFKVDDIKTFLYSILDEELKEVKIK